MTLRDFLEEIDERVQTVMDSDFGIEIVETESVPDFADGYITYDNLDSGIKRCKRLESCVLYVDIRNSAQMSAERRPNTLAKVYASFVRSMISSARYYGGHVRNIIGDRVMVVFDRANCFEVAVDTAVLMNTVTQRVLNKRIRDIEFKCGIGIDYGRMLVTKAGAVRRGEETEFYRSLVWLGRPANVASRLTDLGAKTESYYERGIKEGYYYPAIDEWGWYGVSVDDFLDNLQPTFSPVLRHSNEYFSSFFKTEIGPFTRTYPPILMTAEVYQGYRRARPRAYAAHSGTWSTQSPKVRDYSGTIYGGNVVLRS